MERLLWQRLLDRRTRRHLAAHLQKWRFQPKAFRGRFGKTSKVMNALPDKMQGEELLRLALEKVSAMIGTARNIQSARQTQEPSGVSDIQPRPRQLTGTTGVAQATLAGPAGAWEWDLMTNRMKWSDECFAVFGLPAQALQPSYEVWLDLIHQDDRERVLAEMTEVIQTGKLLNLEYRLAGADGAPRWINSNGQIITDVEQCLVRMYGVVMDITALRQSEESLRRIEQLNQAVLDSSNEHIAVLDRDGNVVSVNQNWRDFARDNSSVRMMRDWIGISYPEVCREATGAGSEEAAVICAGVKDVLSGLLDHFEIEYSSHLPARERWFLMRVSPLSRDSRDQSGAVVAIRDISDRKRGEAERAELMSAAQVARETAESASRAKDEFIARVTHDLRSPLNAILGWAKVLRSQAVDEKTAGEALGTIQHSAEKQERLLKSLLEASRVAGGNLRLNVHPVSLSAVIRSAMEVMRPACEAKEIDCETELATDADAITGDAGRLEQVIWNLVSNAVKFTPGGGRVKVRLERADPYVQITVSDNGQGIRPAHLPRIFERYWQAEDAVKGHSGGLGLGLSFVRHIVELHGGTVRAESDGENKGSKFIISLPYRAVRLQNEGQASIAAASLSTEDQNSVAHDLALQPLTLNGLRALVVDDERDARELVATILRQYGADVIIADSAAEALRMINESAPPPDLLISDISMPLEDGYSLIRKVRSLPPDKGGQIPAIALTAYGRIEDRIRVLSAGFQRHVPKPVEPAELALSAAHLTGRET